VKGGLLLSNVVLDNLYTIPVTFPGMSTPPAGANEKFTGALVYHEGGNGIPAGIYVWNGENWSPATENCTAPALTLTVPLFIKKDATVAFSVASDASARCAEGETYEWFKTDVDGSTYSDPSFGSGAGASTFFADEGDYKVKLSATTPDSPVTIEEDKAITVTADGGPAPNMLTYTYGIVGETCLDVKKTGQDKTAIYADRKDGFPGNNYTKTYKFHHGNSYSDLVLALDDPDHLVAGITSPPFSVDTGSGEKEFTVTFRSNVKDLVPASGNSMTVKLYASYKPQDGPDTKYAYLEIRVEDGTCICPAKISDTQWLNFMCHNLGGQDIISSSQLITREHHGDWYRFGAKQASMKNIATNDTRNNGTWDNANYDSSSTNWPDNPDANTGNPCPAGWRLPDIAELAAVVNRNANNSAISEINPLTNVPATTWTYNSDAELFSHLKKSGDYLYLPAAGLRNSSNGALVTPGSYGYYGSSTGSGTSYGWYMSFDSGSPGVSTTYRSFGFSVRCVQAE
jgi:uncharacterized protein (TIGR02145 family)